MLVISFQNDNDDPARHFYDKYYTAIAKMRDLNALIDNKQFFDHPIKKQQQQQAFENLTKMSKNGAYTTGNLLDDLYHQKIYIFFSYSIL